jgi:hypothetical protein
LYYNTAPAGSNYLVGASNLSFCCTAPLPAQGAGNFTNSPLFINISNDFHLQANSPCINAGNNSYSVNLADLEGNPRIVANTVDVGAYEFQTPGSMLSYAWASQYALPPDGSADFTDADGDGMNNWQEWIAGTNPTNASSALKMLMPLYPNVPPGLMIRWQSVTNRNYFVQSATNLVPAIFSTIATNLPGQPNITTFTDTNIAGSLRMFYRVGVQ